MKEILMKWIGVPYKLGGQSKSGVDCSGFVIEVLKEFYKKPIKDMSAAEIFENSLVNDEIKEYNLIFFSRFKKKPHHIGIILNKDEFIHASTSKGVTVSKINNPYWNQFVKKYGYLKID